MMLPRIWFASAATAFMVAQVHGAVVFQDDFESHATTANGWFTDGDDAADNDPGSPWQIVETGGDIRIQVVSHPQQLSPGPSFPSFAAAEGDQYLHFNQGSTYTENTAWVPLPSTAQTSLTLDAKTFGLSGYDGWHSGLQIIGYGSAATLGTNPAFDIRLLEGGYNVDGTVQIRGAGGVVSTVPGLVHNVNTWETLSIVADLTTDTFSLTLDGVTVNGLTWAGGDLSAIQSIAFMTAASPNLRGAVDALTISTTVVPEPASASVLALGGAALLACRRRRGR